MNSEKNTLWVFGDSFTMGHGCASWYPHEYHKLYPKGDEYMWPNLVAKYLDFNIENKGKEGLSNSGILRTLTQSLKYIRKGDCVIIGKTDSSRFEIPFNNTMRSILINSVMKNNDYNQLDEYLHDYVKYIHVPNYDILDDNVNKSILSIQDLLNKFGVKNFNWSYGKTTTQNNININHYERIFHHTNNEIDDLHFSWNGHKQFSEKIIKIIKTL